VKRLRTVTFPALLAAALSLVAAGHGFAAGDAIVAPPAPPLPSGGPFGPGYDPTRPPPQEPETKGKGIVSAALVAAGPADVEQLRLTGQPDAPPYFGVVLDIRIEAGSTTPALDAASIRALPESGSAVAIVAACLPTMDDPMAVYHRDGVRIGAWNIAIDGRTWACSGRTGRLAIRVGTGGFRVSIKPGADWNGPLVLLFDAQGESPRRVELPGATVELPLPSKPDDAGSDKDAAKDADKNAAENADKAGAKPN